MSKQQSIAAYDRDKRHQLMNDLRAFINSQCDFLVSCKSEIQVKFYGAYFEEGTVKVVLELMDLGSLGAILKLIKLQKERKGEKGPAIPEKVLSKLTQQANRNINNI